MRVVEFSRSILVFFSWFSMLGFLIEPVSVRAEINAPIKARAKTQSVTAGQALHYYQVYAREGFEQFQRARKELFTTELDTLFLRLDRDLGQSTGQSDLHRYYDFSVLTKAVVQFVDELRRVDQWYLIGNKNREQRKRLQQNFIGVSLAIKKSNLLNLQINSEQYNKLHDILVSQATALFYSSYRETQKFDYFWTSYFLHQLNYPMDLTVLHVRQSVRWPIYSSQLARLALSHAHEINRISRADLDTLFQTASVKVTKAGEMRDLQKHYLKQLIRIGDTERVKEVKRLMANQLLISNLQELLSNPLHIFGLIQFLIGYVFVAWPLEFIVIILSLGVFIVQSNSVLTVEEKSKAKNPIRRVWMMFVKAYMGSQVPFFSKLAASLVLFGVGLYFNSARTFVESLITNI